MNWYFRPVVSVYIVSAVVASTAQAGFAATTDGDICGHVLF